MARIAIFLATALIVGIIERMIPFDFVVPGVKLGLSNVVILTAIYIFDFPSVLILVVLKCVVLALLSGSVTSFFYSLCGSMLSFLIMWCMVKLFEKKEKLGPVGVSAVGAVFHNFGQIIAASLIFKTLNVAAYLPVLIVSGVITGVLVGFAVKFSMPYVKKFLGRQACI